MTDRAQEIANATRDAMYANDHAVHALGIEIVEIRQGYAKATMKVRKDMLNGHGMTHGGMTFALADTAFAYACNTYNKTTVASGCEITFSAPSFEGELLTAVAEEKVLMGRSGVYDITVTRPDGTVSALFRGHSRTIKGVVAPEMEEAE